MAGNDTSTEEAKHLVENFVRVFESRLIDEDMVADLGLTGQQELDPNVDSKRG